MAGAIGVDHQGSTLSLDGVYDGRPNRKVIFNRGGSPNIPENLRGRKTPKRRRKHCFDPAIFEERFSTIERVFVREDRFRRLPLRFEPIGNMHYALEALSNPMIKSAALLPILISRPSLA